MARTLRCSCPAHACTFRLDTKPRTRAAGICKPVGELQGALSVAGSSRHTMNMTTFHCLLRSGESSCGEHRVFIFRINILSSSCREALLLFGRLLPTRPSQQANPVLHVLPEIVFFTATPLLAQTCEGQSKCPTGSPGGDTCLSSAQSHFSPSSSCPQSSCCRMSRT